MRWSDLEPEPGIADALDHAGPRPEDGNQNEKRGWSERFANACAVTIAKELRRVKVLQNKRILPLDLKTGTEPLTPLGAGTSKRIDVTVADVLLGLEIGVSLKGLNFRDVGNGNFDKNLTGRLYELGDEVRLIHEHLPHAFVAGIFFLPIEAAADKQKGRTSFAHTVVKLRERTGRLDPALAHHAPRCDIGFVALYATGDEAEGYARGAVRFLNVMERPPFRGRPVLESTHSLSEVVEEIVARAMDRAHIEWADPEPEPDG
jgi:hypothetical protein